MCLFNWQRFIWIFVVHQATCCFMHCSFLYTWYTDHWFSIQWMSLLMTVLCHAFFLTLFPMPLLCTELHLPKDRSFCIKNIPQSAKLLLHLSGSHLATHKLHCSFLLYLASFSFFLSSLGQSFCLQALKKSPFLLLLSFRFLGFFGDQTSHSQLPSASDHLIVC